MVAFPRITRLLVEGYQLFPGQDGSHHYELRFDAGPWVVLGVNGIGKSTLLLLMKHLLVGPYVSRAAGFAGEKTSDVREIKGTLFAARVEDSARNATATLECMFGNSTLLVNRRINNLSLISASVQGSSVVSSVDNEADYQALLATISGMDRFDSVVEILDRVIFKLERRFDLLWNSDAQHSVFKTLLTPDTSAEMRDIEGRIVTADSRARNIQTLLTQASKEIAKEEAREHSKKTVVAQLAEARAALDATETALANAVEAADSAREALIDTRLYLKRAEKDVENTSETYETIKLKALQSTFHAIDQNSSYVLLRILADHQCPACGNDATEFAADIERRQNTNRCVICSSDLSASSKTKKKPETKILSITPALQKKAKKAYDKLKEAHQEREERHISLVEMQSKMLVASERVDPISTEVDRISKKILVLEKHLPKEDRATRHTKQKSINAWRLEIDLQRKNREEAEKEYSELLTALRHEAESIISRLSQRFQERAEPFFGEQAQLKYAPRSRSIGQYGTQFEFPAFEIEMNTGPGFGDFVRREGDQVSLSQREYLDVIFRMSLVETLSPNSGYSFIFDGPEISVDAVFGHRAGKLFSVFADSEKRNLIVACNVVEGALIPETLAKYGTRAMKIERIVNLIDAARPTAALERLRSEYESKIEQIISYDLPDANN